MPERDQDKKDDQRDRLDRPTPRTDVDEGDEDTIDEALRQHEKKEKK